MPPPRRPPRTSPEALHALRERLQATQEAAQRLADEASQPRTPPAGWDVPRRAEEANDELEAIVGVIASLRDVLPDELRAQLADLVRQLLVFVRAVLDWWIDRMEGASDADAASDGGDGRVQDIPIT